MRAAAGRAIAMGMGSVFVGWLCVHVASAQSLPASSSTTSSSAPSIAFSSSAMSAPSLIPSFPFGEIFSLEKPPATKRLPFFTDPFPKTFRDAYRVLYGVDPDSGGAVEPLERTDEGPIDAAIPPYLDKTNYDDQLQCGGWNTNVSVGSQLGGDGKIAKVTGLPGREGEPLGAIETGLAKRNDEYEFPSTTQGWATACEQRRRTITKTVWDEQEKTYMEKELPYPYFEDPPCLWRGEQQSSSSSVSSESTLRPLPTMASSSSMSSVIFLPSSSSAASELSGLRRLFPFLPNLLGQLSPENPTIVSEPESSAAGESYEIAPPHTEQKCEEFSDWLNEFTYKDCRSFNPDGTCYESCRRYTCSDAWIEDSCTVSCPAPPPTPAPRYACINQGTSQAFCAPVPDSYQGPTTDSLPNCAANCGMAPNPQYDCVLGGTRYAQCAPVPYTTVYGSNAVACAAACSQSITPSYYECIYSPGEGNYLAIQVDYPTPFTNRQMAELYCASLPRNIQPVLPPVALPPQQPVLIPVTPPFEGIDNPMNPTLSPVNDPSLIELLRGLQGNAKLEGGNLWASIGNVWTNIKAQTIVSDPVSSSSSSAITLPTGPTIVSDPVSSSSSSAQQCARPPQAPPATIDPQTQCAVTLNQDLHCGVSEFSGGRTFPKSPDGHIEVVMTYANPEPVTYYVLHELTHAMQQCGLPPETNVYQGLSQSERVAACCDYEGEAYANQCEAMEQDGIFIDPATGQRVTINGVTMDARTCAEALTDFSCRQREGGGCYQTNYGNTAVDIANYMSMGVGALNVRQKNIPFACDDSLTRLDSRAVAMLDAINAQRFTGTALVPGDGSRTLSAVMGGGSSSSQGKANAIRCTGEECRCPGEGCTKAANGREYQSFFRNYDARYERGTIPDVTTDKNENTAQVACYGFYEEFDPKTHVTQDKDRRCMISIDVSGYAESQAGHGQYGSLLADPDPQQNAEQRDQGDYDETTDIWFKKLGRAFTLVNERVLQEKYDGNLIRTFLDVDTDRAVQKASPQISEEQPYAVSNETLAFDDTGIRSVTRWWQKQQTAASLLLRKRTVKIIMPGGLAEQMEDNGDLPPGATQPAEEESDGLTLEQKRSLPVEAQLNAQPDVLGEFIEGLKAAMLLPTEEEPVPLLLPLGTPTEFRAQAQAICSAYMEDKGEPSCSGAPENVTAVIRRLEEYADAIEEVRTLRGELARYLSAVQGVQEQITEPVDDWMRDNLKAFDLLTAEPDKLQEALLPAWTQAHEAIARVREQANLPWCMNQRYTLPIYSLLDPWLPSREQNSLLEEGLPDITRFVEDIYASAPDSLSIDFSTTVDMRGQGSIKIPVLKPRLVRLKLPTAGDYFAGVLSVDKLPSLPSMVPIRQAMQQARLSLPEVNAPSLPPLLPGAPRGDVTDPELPSERTVDPQLISDMNKIVALAQGMEKSYDEFWKSLSAFEEEDTAPSCERQGDLQALECCSWNAFPCVHTETDLLERLTRIGSRPMVSLPEDYASAGTPRLEPGACLPEDHTCVPPAGGAVRDGTETRKSLHLDVIGPEREPQQTGGDAIDRIRRAVDRATLPSPVGDVSPEQFPPYDIGRDEILPSLDIAAPQSQLTPDTP